jgi:pilus assembly protein Flp/PilA
MKKFLRDESGATAIEYAFIAMLISLFVIAGASGAGSKLGSHFNNVKGNLG